MEIPVCGGCAFAPEQPAPVALNMQVKACRLVCVVHGDQHIPSCKGIAGVGEHQLPVLAIGEIRLLGVDLPQLSDQLDARALFSPQSLQVQAWPQARIRPLLLAAFDAELGPIVDRRDPRECIEQHMHRLVVSLIPEFGHDAFHVMVVHKAVEMHIPADAHFHLPAHGVSDLKVIVVVVPAVQSLMEMVISHGMECLIIDPPMILTVDHLTHKPELFLHLAGQPPQTLHELKVQNVRRIQPQSVDIELADPEPHRVQEVIPDLRIPLVQLHQQIVSAPVIVTEAVIILIISPEIHIAVPVLVPAVLPVCEQVPEGKEVSACVVEHGIEYHPDPRLMTSPHEVLQILVGPQPAVQLPVIRGLIAVPHRLKKRSNIKSVAPDLPDMVDPRIKIIQPVHRLPIIIQLRRPRQPKRINMIKNCTFIPSHTSFSFCCFSGPTESRPAVHSPRRIADKPPDISCPRPLIPQPIAIPRPVEATVRSIIP